MATLGERPDDLTDMVQLPENGEFNCPLCRDYKGPIESVEAHISAKRDRSHRGVVGKDFRIQIRHGDDILSARLPVNELLEEALRHSSEIGEL